MLIPATLATVDRDGGSDTDPPSSAAPLPDIRGSGTEFRSSGEGRIIS